MENKRRVDLLTSYNKHLLRYFHVYWDGYQVFKIRHWITTSKNTKFTGGDWHVNKYSYFRVNKGNGVSVYKICDVTVGAVINCSMRGRRPDQGGFLDLITRSDG